MFITKFTLATINARLTKLETEADGARRELHLQFEGEPYIYIYWVPVKECVRMMLNHLKMKPSCTPEIPAGFELKKTLVKP